MHTVSLLAGLRGDLGRGRAWVRLALEKKTLSAHLELLLWCDLVVFMLYALCDKPLFSTPASWAPLYRPDAVLLLDDTRDQLLSHLLTLTAVELPVFTPFYPNVALSYRFVIATAR